MKEPLKIKNGMHIVVSNLWGENISGLIEIAEQLGYHIGLEKITLQKKFLVNQKVIIHL